MDEAFRMPAEWEEHQAIWLARPHDRLEWGAYFQEASAAVEQLAHSLANSGERVQLLIPEADTPRGPNEHALAYGDIWLRDTGPLFVEAGEKQIAVAFAFNGWGGKYDFPGDKQVAQQIANAASVSLVRHSLVAEGGAIEVDGKGTLITTRQCLLNKNRNPQLDQQQVEQALAAAIGAKHVIWLEQGLCADHTDGHVDNLARFVAPGRVVCATPVRGTANHDVHHDIYSTLQRARDATGEPLEVVGIPSPEPVHGPEGPMPASYCNFLIANESVVVPVFEVPSDDDALAIVADLFPSRNVVALEARALLTGGGTVHCISQQQPKHPENK